MLSGARSSTPLIARMKSPTDDVDAGRRQRRAQIRIPALAVVDARDLVAAAFDREVGAEQAARRRRHVRHVAAAHVRVADGDLGAHVVEQVVEIGAVVDVRQQRAVHLLHLRPVRRRACSARRGSRAELRQPSLKICVNSAFGSRYIRSVTSSRPCAGRRRAPAIGVDEEQRRGRAAGAARVRRASGRRRRRCDRAASGRRR